MDRKMIFFDIDGTLVPECTNDIPESAKNAIKTAIANGHLAFINSGRTLINIHETVKELGFSGYCCGCGTEIYVGDHTLYYYELPLSSCNEIIDFFYKNEISALFEGSNSLYILGKDAYTPDTASIEESMGVKFIPLDTKELRNTAQFTKLLYWAPNHMVDSVVQEFLFQWFDIIDRGDGVREVVPKNHSKATAIQKLCDHFQIPLENCYAIGDSTNDLPMLEYVPHAIAMGVSMKEILPYVEYQTDTVENDGIEKALKHYEII